MTLNLTTPPGRMVQGSLYKMDERKDNNNQTVIGKDGKPVMICYFAVAVPKLPGEKGWWETVWGKQIHAVGAAANPNQYQTPSYAWKIEDGDSLIPNKRGRKNAERDGFPGNWIIKFSSGFIPPLYTLIGQRKPAALMQENAIMPGAFIEVNLNVAPNGRTDSPGLYLNPALVCLVGYGQPIAVGPDPDAAGFGANGAPAGASMTPVAALGPIAPAVPAAAAPAPLTPSAPVPAALTPAAAPVPVQPHTAILNPPGPVPAAPMAPAAPAARQMTAKAAGTPYEEFLKTGWTDDTLRSHGYML